FAVRIADLPAVHAIADGHAQARPAIGVDAIDIVGGNDFLNDPGDLLAVIAAELAGGAIIGLGGGIVARIHPPARNLAVLGALEPVGMFLRQIQRSHVRAHASHHACIVGFGGLDALPEDIAAAQPTAAREI